MKPLSFVVVMLALPVDLLAQATIEGDLYLLTRGGEIRQGAANEVALIERRPLIAERWGAICEAQAAVRVEADNRSSTQMIDSINQLPPNQRGPALQEAIVRNEARMEALMAEVRQKRDERFAFLRSLAIRQAPTGMQAHYRMEAPPGDYWLFAVMMLGDVPNIWLHPVTLTGATPLTVDLDNTNVEPTGAGRLNCDRPFPILE
ncbi:MAG: hypothetical protein ABL963_06825 [Longimicrobiales bacterium]